MKDKKTHLPISLNFNKSKSFNNKKKGSQNYSKLFCLETNFHNIF